MTIYELISIVLSAVALIAGTLVPMIKKAVSKPKLTILPFDYQPLLLEFNPRLSWFAFGFSIACERASCIVRSIEADVTCTDDGRTLKYRWCLIEPIWVNSASGNGASASFNSWSRAHPVWLQDGSLEPLNIDFCLMDESGIREVAAKKDALYKKIYAPIEGVLGKEQYFEIVQRNLSYKELLEDVKKNFFWHEGRYILKLSIGYDVKSSMSQSFRFDITAENESALVEHMEHIVLCDGCPTKAASCRSYASVSVDIIG